MKWYGRAILCHPGAVSPSAALADYRAALTTPGAGLPALASAVGRLPIAMLTLATLLYVEGMTGSFAVAGLVSAGALVGVSAGSVLQGRLIDRVGPTVPLLVASGLLVAAAAALVLAVETGQPPVVLGLLAVVTGLTQPALPGSSRALWGRLLPAGPHRDAAYSYEAISLEVFFILGPALAVFLVLAPWPGTGLAVAVGGLALGSVAFALCRPVRAQGRAERGPGLGLFGAMERPGVRTVTLASLGFGLVVGSVEVGVPAVTDAIGAPALGGVLLSAWSVTSVLAGVLYSLRPWPEPLHLRLPFLLAVFAACVGGMALSGTSGGLPVLVVAMLLAGAVITPQVTAHSLGIDRTAPAGTAAEAFGWVITAATLGIAAGQSSAGVAVELAGPPAAFTLGAVAGLVVAGLLWLLRGTLAPAPAAELPVRA
jgi:hypothetical protein